MNKLYIEQVSKNALVPTKGSTHAACYDLYSDLAGREVKIRDALNDEYTAHCQETITLGPLDRALIPTGWKMQCPEGMSIDFLPRSGTAWKVGLTVVNTPGVIDHDYQNECFVAVINHSGENININHGDRIAQMRLVPVLDTELIEAELPEVNSNRTGGFGSSGK